MHFFSFYWKLLSCNKNNTNRIFLLLPYSSYKNLNNSAHNMYIFSAGKSGKVARSSPSIALLLVNCVPVSCIPWPLSPVKFINTSCKTSYVFAMVLCCVIKVGKGKKCKWLKVASRCCELRIKNYELREIMCVPKLLFTQRLGTNGRCRECPVAQRNCRASKVFQRHTAILFL